MALEIPSKIAKEEWEKLPDDQKPIFRQSEKEPGLYEYYVPTMFASMKNAKTEREAERRAREAAEAELANYRKFGDASVFEELHSRSQILADGTKTIEEAIKRANREAEEKFKQINAAKDQRISALEQRRRNDYQNNIVTALLTNAGVDPDYQDEIKMSFGRMLKTEMKDDELVVYVMDPERPGELMKDPDTHDPVTPQRAFQLFREQKSKLFKGDTGDNSGAGFSPGTSQAGGSFDSDPLTWNFETKKAYFATMGGGENAKKQYEKKLTAWTQRREKERQASKA